jgi:hypothetical protein
MGIRSWDDFIWHGILDCGGRFYESREGLEKAGNRRRSLEKVRGVLGWKNFEEVDCGRGKKWCASIQKAYRYCPSREYGGGGGSGF